MHRVFLCIVYALIAPFECIGRLPHDSVLGTPADRITSALDPRAPACHLFLCIPLTRALTHSVPQRRQVFRAGRPRQGESMPVSRIRPHLHTSAFASPQFPFLCQGHAVDRPVVLPPCRYGYPDGSWAVDVPPEVREWLHWLCLSHGMQRQHDGMTRPSTLPCKPMC